MADETLHGLDIDPLDGFGREGDRALEAHVVRRLAGHQDRRHQHVRPLCNEFCPFHTVQVVGADWQMQTVLL
jgi:hypothetical protein